MKKHLLLLSAAVLAILAISCTEENGLDKSADGEESEYSYTTLDGAREEGSSGVSGWDDGSGGAGGSGNGDSVQTTPPEPGQVTAAEWNDLVNWDFWNDLGQNQDFTLAQDNWAFENFYRYSFLVKDIYDFPLIDCEIQLKDSKDNTIWTARTDNEGKAELWHNLYHDQSDDVTKAVVFYKDNIKEIADPLLFAEGVNEIIMENEADILLRADIMFVVDATGSMSDEINYLKSELLSVINRVEKLNSQLDLRLGSVFYRDEGDDYLTRVSPFSDNIESTVNFIKEQEANGGGDFPEAVHTALNMALTQMSWSESARTRILFLLLDAPPHNTPGIVNDIRNSVYDAAGEGIKIIPITASGIDKDTEFLMRFFALGTNGTYVFITDDSGIGGDHLEATVGEYEVELLNDLMVRLIDKYTK
ncbi:MAG: VWA domain-containing protein [Bacteroidales bacterium]|nr:VWA domain-containing protein [Bacteroidales bacterium]MBN2761775.1 VWA domain-containing protein [Bacteroidales bacterium]